MAVENVSLNLATQNVTKTIKLRILSIMEKNLKAYYEKYI